MKEQVKAPEKIQISDKEIANLSDAQFKTLIIRMLTEMLEYGHKIEEEVKAMQSEIEENVQGTNSDGKETGAEINNLEEKEEISIKPEQNEEIRIQQNEERPRNPLDNLKCSNIRIIEVPEGQEREQEIENLFEKNSKNFPNMTKEIDFQEIQGAQ